MVWWINKFKNLVNACIQLSMRLKWFLVNIHTFIVYRNTLSLYEWNWLICKLPLKIFIHRFVTMVIFLWVLSDFPGQKFKILFLSIKNRFKRNSFYQKVFKNLQEGYYRHWHLHLVCSHMRVIWSAKMKKQNKKTFCDKLNMVCGHRFGNIQIKSFSFHIIICACGEW